MSIKQGKSKSIAKQTVMSNILLLILFVGLFNELISKIYRSPAVLIELLPMM